MFETFRQPLLFTHQRQNSAPAASSARPPGSDDDLALGCECANPSLQIERWGEDEPALPATSFPGGAGRHR